MKTINTYDCLADNKGQDKKPDEPKVDPEDYISLDDYTRQKDSKTLKACLVPKTLVSIDPEAPVPGLEN